jgi:hypothetical protein
MNRSESYACTQMQIAAKPVQNVPSWQKPAPTREVKKPVSILAKIFGKK